jgi:single-stranded DNA-binding protein
MSISVTVRGVIDDAPKRCVNRAGDVWTNFIVVSTDRRRFAADKEWHSIETLVHIEATDGLAERVLREFSKGDTVLVKSSQLKADTWQDDLGRVQPRALVVASDIQISEPDVGGN